MSAISFDVINKMLEGFSPPNLIFIGLLLILDIFSLQHHFFEDPTCGSKLPSHVWIYVTPCFLCLWDFSGEGRHFLLQEFFQTQGPNLHLLHCGQIVFTAEPLGQANWLLLVFNLDWGFFFSYLPRANFDQWEGSAHGLWGLQPGRTMKQEIFRIIFLSICDYFFCCYI